MNFRILTFSGLGPGRNGIMVFYEMVLTPSPPSYLLPAAVGVDPGFFCCSPYPTFLVSAIVIIVILSNNRQIHQST